MQPAAIERRNRRMCLIIEGMWASFLGTPVMTLYYQKNGLSQTEIFALQSTLNIMLIVADMPFGYIADRYGIRRVIIAASTLWAVQSVAFCFSHGFWQFEISLILTGIYVAAMSNATSVMMTLSLGYIEDPKERHDRYNDYEANVSRTRAIGMIAGASGGSLAVSWWGISGPFMAQPFTAAAAIIPAVFMIRPAHKIDEPHHPALAMVTKVMRTMLIDNKDVRYLSLFATSIMTTGFAFWWLIQPRMQVAHIADVHFGPIYIVRAIGVAVLVRLIPWSRRLGDQRILAMMVVVPAAIASFSGLTIGYGGIALMMLMQGVLQPLFGVILRSYVHDALPHDYSTRTAELSVITSLFSVGYAAIGPICGAIIEAYSLQAALLVIAAVSLCSNGALYYAFRKNM